MNSSENPINDDIRETFYNTIICVAMENNIGANDLNGLNRLQLLSNIVLESLKIIRNSSRVGFYTVKGRHINQNNVPEYYKELYNALEQTKQIRNSNQLNNTLRRMAIGIIGKDLFTSIINKVINFYLEASGVQIQNEQITPNNNNSANQLNKRYIRNPQGDALTEDIRQTFYDIMMIAVQHDSDIIPHEDIITFEPYVVIGMPALSIIYNILNSTHSEGIELLSGRVLTNQNCPIYKELFKKLFEVKQLFKTKKLTDNQIIFLKHKVVNNPSKPFPEQLERLNSPDLMNIVAKITDIALDISRLYEFKKNMGQFIQ
jgi:hypothetical protein